ncbi:hypothetical protein R1sor_009420 [Riccia sorocarpa]|uniref:DUF7869 domain-containing protein n=1 Tax=Riccia sorocarpa TaxID=122646 RepID=A0ABD3I182_9MARC
MLTHGREPGAFCHLSVNGLWPGDPNFTVSSLARCLRDLEFVPDGGDHTGDLSRTTSNIPLFSSLLDQSAFIDTMGSEGAIDSTYFQQHGNGNMPSARDTVRSPTFKKLPPVLMLQMDNSAKDNKNLHILAFCSELVICGVFETVEDGCPRGRVARTAVPGDALPGRLSRGRIARRFPAPDEQKFIPYAFLNILQVNFLMVGHTHEDVDALFSKVLLLAVLGVLYWQLKRSAPRLDPAFLKL